MASSTNALLNLDPEHISCIGGRTVVTCKSCAGNAPRYIYTTPTQTYKSNTSPRGSICSSCNGRGFNIFVCAHCNPAAAAAAARAIANPTSATATTPGSTAPSSPGSLSRSSSTSFPSHPDPRAARSYGGYSDGSDGTSCGRIDTNANRSRNPWSDSSYGVSDILGWYENGHSRLMIRGSQPGIGALAWSGLRRNKFDHVKVFRQWIGVRTRIHDSYVIWLPPCCGLVFSVFACYFDWLHWMSPYFVYVFCTSLW